MWTPDSTTSLICRSHFMAGNGPKAMRRAGNLAMAWSPTLKPGRNITSEFEAGIQRAGKNN